MLLLVGYVAYGAVGAPRYKYTVHETKLIVDGEEVTVTGLLECARDFLGLPTDKPSIYHMLGGTAAAATRLKNGGAVLTMFPDACSAGPGRDANAMDHPGVYPAIYLIDSATKPSRIDYYFSDVSLRDPKSRVRLVDFHARQSWSPIRSYHLLARYRWGNLSSAVPGLMDDLAIYVGYTMTVLPFSELTDDERSFLEPLLTTTNDDLIWIRPNSPEVKTAVRDLLRQTNMHIPDASVGRMCPPWVREADPDCDAFRRTFGLPLVDGVPTLTSDEELQPYVEMTRRPKVAGADQDGTRAVLPPDAVTEFNLFGRLVAFSKADFFGLALVAPREQIAFGIEAQLFSKDRVLQQR